MFKLYFLLSLCLSLLTLSTLRIPSTLRTNPGIAHAEQSTLRQVTLHQVTPFAKNRIVQASAYEGPALERSIVQREEAVIATPNRIRSKGAWAQQSKLGANSRKNDIIVPHNARSTTQGQAGSCHIFTMSQVLAALIFGETGKYLDPASYFSDHLVRESKTTIKNPTKTFMNTHLKDIKAIRAGGECREFEGGYFSDDLKLIQMVGSELIGLSSKEYSSVVRAVGELKSAKNSLINSKLDLTLAAQEAKLEKPAREIISRSVFGNKDKDTRAIVKGIVRNVKFLSLRFQDRYGNFPVDKAYKSAKMDLIDLLHKNGVLWLGVDAATYYGKGKPKIQVDSLFSRTGDHAIALVGYQTAGDMFLIKDSNRQGLYKISADRLLPSLEEAYALK